MSHRLVHTDHINITSQRVFYGPDKYCMDDLIVTHNYTGKYFIRLLSTYLGLLLFQSMIKAQ